MAFISENLKEHKPIHLFVSQESSASFKARRIIQSQQLLLLVCLELTKKAGILASITKKWSFIK